MIEISYKGCTLGITERDDEDKVRIYAFTEIDGEYFVLQEELGDAIDVMTTLDELKDIVDEMTGYDSLYDNKAKLVSNEEEDADEFDSEDEGENA